MPRKAAKNVPGTERYRDERRKGAGPRMHSREWHDHDEPRDLEPIGESVGNEAVPEAESGPEHTGMGRRRYGGTSLSQSGEHRKRTTPPSKGPKQKPGAPKKTTGHGHRRANRA